MQKDGSKEENKYKLNSILSNVSKVYERCLYDQIYDFLKIGFQNTMTVFSAFHGRKDTNNP